MGPHFPVPQLMTGRHKGWSLPETVMLLVVISRPEAVTWVKRLWVGVYNILCLSDNNKISEPCWCKTKAVVFWISAPGNRTYSMSTASNRGVSREVFKGVSNPLFWPVVYRVFNLLSRLLYRLTISTDIPTVLRRIPTVWYECRLPDLAISPPHTSVSSEVYFGYFTFYRRK